MNLKEDNSKKFRHPDALTQRNVTPQVPDIPNADHKKRTKGSTPQPPKRHLFRKFIVFMIVLGIISSSLYAVYIVSIVAKISTNSWQLSPLSADSGGRINILVLGVGDPGHAGEQLTDTVMLLSLNPSSSQMAQVSLPRDMRVLIPGYGMSKINAANALGGVSLAEQTVSDNLTTPIHYYLKANFSGLRNLVDAVGGVDVTVKERLRDVEYPCDYDQGKACGLDISPGLQHMDGTKALQYVRCRKGTCGNDFGRAARQQELIGLLKPKILNPSLLLHPFALSKIVTAVQMGTKTDLGFIQMLQLAQLLREDSKNQTISLVLSTSAGGYLYPDPRGSSDLLPIGGNFNAISERIATIFHVALP